MSKPLPVLGNLTPEIAQIYSYLAAERAEEAPGAAIADAAVGGDAAVTELIADHATQRTWDTEVTADHETICELLAFQRTDGVIGGDFTISGTAAATLLGAGCVLYRIGGKLHYCALDTTITLEDSGDITQNKFGAWRIEIDRTGTVTATDTGAAMAFNTAEDALLNLSAVARGSGVTIGYVTITDSGGAFNIGTTNTSGGTATAVVYHVRGNYQQSTGLTAANGAASAVGSTPVNYSTGTKDVVVNGVKLAQIAAEADKAFDDLDTIAEAKFGAWLIVTNLAQSATYALAANGVAGAVSAMAYDTAPMASLDIDARVDALPEIFCPVARVIIENNLAGVWTAGTDDLNGTDGTATWTDATSGTWGRLKAAQGGFDAHQINPPSVPALLSSLVPAALTAVDDSSTTRDKLNLLLAQARTHGMIATA